MPQLIDGLSYPENAAELLAERRLMQMMLNTFTSAEVQHRMAFLKRPPEPLRVYEEYIAAGAAQRIALPNQIKDLAAELIETGCADPAAWQAIVDLMDANCRAFLEERVMPAFFNTKKCKAFEKLHRAALESVAAE